MITLNNLDQATYNNLRLQILKNVEEEKDVNGQPILSKTVYFDGNADGVGNPTIGIGMNLRDDAVRKFFVKWILDGFDAATDTNIRLVDIAISAAVASNSSFNTAAKLQTELNKIIKDITGNPSATCSFLSDQEVENAFVGLAQDIYEKRVDSKATKYGLTINFSYERLALLSLSYNGGLGDKLMEAIRDNNRPEAWFEIRYRTNKNQLPGLAKRRYYESQIFSLYNDRSANGVVTNAEVRAIEKMHKDHSTKISEYDAQFESNVANANRDYGSTALSGGKVQNFRESLARSRNYITSQYLSGEDASKINQISFAENSDNKVALASALASDPLVVPLKIKSSSSAKVVSSNLRTESFKNLEETLSYDDDVASQSFDDDTSYYADDDVVYEEKQKVNSLLVGNSKEDVFYIDNLSGSDHVVSTVNDGKIIIDGITLSGNALPKTDSNNVKIEGVWNLSGFDLHKVANDQGGYDLMIVKSGADVSNEEVGKVSVKNFSINSHFSMYKTKVNFLAQNYL